MPSTTWLPTQPITFPASLPVPDVPLTERARARRAPAFQVTERDRSILHALYRYRVLDRHQIERLFFSNFSDACCRLRLLWQHGYVERILRRTHPSDTQARRALVYRLGARGAKLVADDLGQPFRSFWYWGRGDDKDRHATSVSYPFLEHAIALADIRISLERAATNTHCTIELWRDDADIRRAKLGDHVHATVTPDTPGAPITLLPDGYVVLSAPTGQRGHFFLEADRGSESIANKWRKKIGGYKALFASGVFHRRYAVVGPHIAFRVLTTTPSLARAQHLKAAAERIGDARLAQLFLFAPFFEVMTKDPLTTPIWLRGGTTEAQALL